MNPYTLNLLRYLSIRGSHSILYFVSFQMEGFSSFKNKLDIRYQLGPNWDIYLATFLGIILGILVILRRAR